MKTPISNKEAKFLQSGDIVRLSSKSDRSLSFLAKVVFRHYPWNNASNFIFTKVDYLPRKVQTYKNKDYYPPGATDYLIENAAGIDLKSNRLFDLLLLEDDYTDNTDFFISEVVSKNPDYHILMSIGEEMSFADDNFNEIGKAILLGKDDQGNSIFYSLTSELSNSNWFEGKYTKSPDALKIPECKETAALLGLDLTSENIFSVDDYSQCKMVFSNISPIIRQDYNDLKKGDLVEIRDANGGNIEMTVVSNKKSSGKIRLAQKHANKYSSKLEEDDFIFNYAVVSVNSKTRIIEASVDDGDLIICYSAALLQEKMTKNVAAKKSTSTSNNKDDFNPNDFQVGDICHIKKGSLNLNAVYLGVNGGEAPAFYLHENEAVIFGSNTLSKINQNYNKIPIDNAKSLNFPLDEENKSLFIYPTAIGEKEHQYQVKNTGKKYIPSNEEISDLKDLEVGHIYEILNDNPNNQGETKQAIYLGLNTLGNPAFYDLDKTKLAKDNLSYIPKDVNKIPIDNAKLLKLDINSDDNQAIFPYFHSIGPNKDWHIKKTKYLPFSTAAFNNNETQKIIDDLNTYKLGDLIDIEYRNEKGIAIYLGKDQLGQYTFHSNNSGVKGVGNLDKTKSKSNLIQDAQSLGLDIKEKEYFALNPKPIFNWKFKNTNQKYFIPFDKLTQLPIGAEVKFISNDNGDIETGYIINKDNTKITLFSNNLKNNNIAPKYQPLNIQGTTNNYIFLNKDNNTALQINTNCRYFTDNIQPFSNEQIAPNFEFGDIISFEEENRNILPKKAIYLGLSTNRLPTFYALDEEITCHWKDTIIDSEELEQALKQRPDLQIFNLDTKSNRFFHCYSPMSGYKYINTKEKYKPQSTFKSEISNALYRSATDQSVIAVQKLLSSTLSNTDQAADILTSDLMNCILRLSVGYGLSYSKFYDNNPYVNKIAQELRASGLANTGNLLIEKTILPIIQEFLSSQNNIRVDTSISPIKNDTQFDDDITTYKEEKLAV